MTTDLSRRVGERKAAHVSSTVWTVCVAMALITGVAVIGTVLSTTSSGTPIANELPGITTAHPTLSVGDPTE